MLMLLAQIILAVPLLRPGLVSFEKLHHFQRAEA